MFYYRQIVNCEIKLLHHHMAEWLSFSHTGGEIQSPRVHRWRLKSQRGSSVALPVESVARAEALDPGDVADALSIAASRTGLGHGC